MEYFRTKPFWLEKFESHTYFRNVKLKKPHQSYLTSQYLDLDSIEVVPPDIFIKIEDDRIPVFNSNHIHQSPYLESYPGFFHGERLLAVMAVSPISGFKSGLRIYAVSADQKYFKISEGILIAEF